MRAGWKTIIRGLRDCEVEEFYAQLTRDDYNINGAPP